MIGPEAIIKDFSRLGEVFSELHENAHSRVNLPEEIKQLSDIIENSRFFNPWFIPPFVHFAFAAWAGALKPRKIEKWLSDYEALFDRKRPEQTVGIIMAGNIPMVGLHDLLCVLASGNHALIRLSGDDDRLIPAVLNLLCRINPEYERRFTINRELFKDFRAIIATGSNNTSRYFEYYFGKYPSIIRKNRNGTAILSGIESDEEIRSMADDIFMYFGMGCRNVSKVYVPEGYDITRLFNHCGHYSFLADMHKYMNNYDYQKSIFLINRVRHFDNGFLLIKEDPSFFSPVSVLHYQYYSPSDHPGNLMVGQTENIQCIVSCVREIKERVPFGLSQVPELWDYADKVDTMKFLLSL
jgi:hypothetical protein